MLSGVSVQASGERLTIQGGKPMLRTMWMVAVVVSVTGCATGAYVHTPEEWLAHFKQGSLFRGTVTSDIDRPQAAVIKDLTEFSKNCIDGMAIRSSLQQGNNMASSITLYTAGIRRTRDGQNLLFIQAQDKYAKQEGEPAGGNFVFVTEITGSGSKTKIASHYLTAFKQYTAPVEQWARGRKSSCPKKDLR